MITLALVTVSCGASGSPEPTAAPSATPQQSPSVTEPMAEGSYESVRAMQLDVEAAFYLCSAPMKVYDPPTIDGAQAQADCSSEVTLLIFDPNDVQTGAAALLGAPDGPLSLLAGDNWIITCSSDQATCEQIQGVTGGELLTAS